MKLAGLLSFMLALQLHGAPVVLYSSGFEGTDGGWTESGFGDWERGSINFTSVGCDTAPAAGPAAANSGSEAWGTILNGCYTNANSDSILSQTFDLTGYSTASFSWYQWVHVFETFDYAILTANGTQLYRSPDSLAHDWAQHTVDLTPFVGGPVTLQFLLHATTVVNRAGWYLDDMELIVDGNAVPEPSAWLLSLAGLGALAAAHRSRRR